WCKERAGPDTDRCRRAPSAAGQRLLPGFPWCLRPPGFPKGPRMKWFEIGLVVLTCATGLVWLLDRLFFARRRARAGGLLDEEPAVVDYSRAFFPVLAAVLVLRSFVAEPYKIPSSSMMPNLLIGDFILVNKFSYGLRLPVNNRKVVALGEPARGDVVVFKPPHDPEQNWIKRVIGLPGDHIACRGDTLFVNGEEVRYTP